MLPHHYAHNQSKLKKKEIKGEKKIEKEVYS